MGLKVAELESLFTADITPFAKKASEVEAVQKKLDGARSELVITADGSKALLEIDSVENAAHTIPSAEFDITADAAPAARELDRIERHAGKAGVGGGAAFAGGLTGAIVGGPMVGLVLGALTSLGEGAWQAFLSGFQTEARTDKLMAQTGLDEQAAGVMGRAAGEAYANNWGESIAANMDTARIAIQDGLLDPDATARDAEKIISSLAGVADVLEEDVSRVARSATTLLRTGLAPTAQDAFDIIIKGQQAGLNISEDWLDTLNEYSTKFRDLGLSAEDALGLMAQAVRGGARDTDKAADALKEFAIRAIDGSTATAAGFQNVGLNADIMREKIAAGGPSAREALGQTLDALRAIEDPALRDAAAVALFGTQAEDLGDALYSMNLNTAAEQLGTVAGAAKKALDTMGDNAAGSIESARRNIEVAAQGIQAALATAFGPQIEEAATYISENREAVMQFLLDLGNGALDLARNFVDGAAWATEAWGDYVGTVGPPILDLIDNVLEGFYNMAKISDPTGLLGIKDNAKDALDSFREVKDGAEDAFTAIDEGTSEAADALRTNLIENGIDPAQAKLNEMTIPMLAQARVHDVTVALANDIGAIGYAADGTTLTFSTLNDQIDVTSASSAEMDAQIRSVVAGMEDQVATAIEAGESQADYTGRVNEARDALIAQLEAMGLTHEEALRMADAYGAIPTEIVTKIEAETAYAQGKIDSFIKLNNGKTLTFYLDAKGNQMTPYYNAMGGVLQPMAAGGLTGSALDPVAQMVSPGALRIIGDRMDVSEAYIPLDGSARSRAILMETIRRMPGLEAMASGGLTSGAGLGGGDTYQVEVRIDAKDITELNTLVEFFRTVRRRSRQASGIGD